jgi:ribosomal subunit interface protein
VAEKIESLRKYLKHFEEDVLHLHGNIEKNPHREEYFTSFNLYLPKMVLHCRAAEKRLEASVNRAFAELARQLDKQKTKFMRRFRQ